LKDISILVAYADAIGTRQEELVVKANKLPSTAYSKTVGSIAHAVFVF
jgi:hypothetical protein